MYWLALVIFLTVCAGLVCGYMCVCVCVCVKQVWKGMQDWCNPVSVHFRYCH